MTPPRAHSPIDPWHRAHGARFRPSGGWELPVAYAGVEREVAAVRSGCGLADLSAFSKWRVVGRATPDAVEALGAPAASRIHGVARVNGMWVCRLADDSLLLLGDSTDRGIPVSLPAGTRALLADATFALAGFCLAGPFADQLLPKLASLDPAALPLGACAETSVGGVAALLVRAEELTVPSLRLYVARDFAEYLCGRLHEAGRDVGLVPFGLEAFSALSRAGRG
jgi:aminomethyltransferase